MRIILLCIFSSCFMEMTFCQGAHSTNFKPGEDGFHFSNAFTNTLYEQQGIKITVSGCNGGMCYAALDYYNRKSKAPRQSFLPANHSLLYDYIYYRQMGSLFENADKWFEFTANPFGWQNNEFYNWGLQGTSGGRFSELKSYIDNGIPVPIGLFATTDGRSLPNNQALAIGYDCGRYQGALGDYIEDFKIFCYNPEYPDIVSTLQVNKTMHYYYWKDHENDGDHYAGYFVDAKYKPGTPPPDLSSAASLPDCKTRELLVQILSGEDGLRGGDEHCNIILQFNDGTVQQFLNVNRSLPWLPGTANTVELWLANPVPMTSFKSILIYSKPCDSLNKFTCNSWNLNRLTIQARGGFPDETILNLIGKPLLRRFSGKDFSSTFYFTNLPACEPGTPSAVTGEPVTGPSTTNQLFISFRTGSDDLHGGQENLGITVSFRDGTSQTFSNVNAGMNWPVNSSNNITLNLKNEVGIPDIISLKLQTFKCQESSCDIWNFQGITVKAFGNNQSRIIYEQSGNPIYKFTGSNNVYNIILMKY